MPGGAQVIGVTLLLVVLASMVDSSTAELRPGGATPPPPGGWRPNIIAKLNPSICNWDTGAVSSANLDRAKRQAAAAGLQYAYALPVDCWHVFKPAATDTQTDAALAALIVRKYPKAAKTAAASGESLPFAMAERDQLVHTMQPGGSGISRPDVMGTSAVQPAIARAAQPATADSTQNVTGPGPRGVGMGLAVQPVAGPGSGSAAVMRPVVTVKPAGSATSTTVKPAAGSSSSAAEPL